MPTYEYVCAKCGHQFEVMQKMSDPPKKRCPECSGKVERKIGTGAGLIFKGSGFYITDYRSSEYKAKQKAESGSTETAKSDGAKSDSAGSGGSGAGAGAGPGGSSTEKAPTSKPEKPAKPEK